ncbi:two-partner secretion domain-containing protein [Leptolyngbya sp. NIES-2104]|uniref:two-partner secretion domain-containing protein n=1 Tax=Leptolyngbya sp. NIES-2104 TaxID=1552121 RepID=UPI0006ECB290|nr:S-layer family protein [Leptolyngbya sp. NIES-2104]GAP94220.1 putative hemagglutinin-related protein [Leptolyngbya sp. NIES-2104]
MIPRSWFSPCWKISSYIVLVVIFLLEASESSTAQVVPDNTLGNESSIVTPNIRIRGVESARIDGGAVRGANLFHSFEQFNVGVQRGVYFANPVGIDNILSRVTGANSSEILGRLGVLGDANLFLINPKGIVFGPASSLDVQGSFLATTANAVRLGDTGLFSASQPATSNLLSVRPSAFWFNAVAAQPIVNRSFGASQSESQAPSLTGQPNSNEGISGLQVRSGQTLALVGGDVLLEGGNLTAAQGRIELGSVTGVGQVNFAQSGNSFVLGYDAISAFGNVGLSNGAFVNANGAGGGDVQIRGERLEMTQGSKISAGTLGTGNGGGIRIRARDVFLSQGSSIDTNVAATGTGGDIKIDTNRLLVQGGALIQANILGAGKGGSLQIIATDSIEVRGVSANGRVPSGLFAQSEGRGDAGELRIDTQRLRVQDGAQVATSNFGQGKGGSLQITAADSVELMGATDNNRFASGVFAVSQGSGDAGNVRINTGRLRVSDGAQILVDTLRAGSGGSLQITAANSVEVMNTSTNGRIRSVLSARSGGNGDAGNIRIDTQRLRVQGGAQIGAGTFGAGKGGSLQITAADSIEVSGTTADGQGVSGLFTQSQGRGNAGDLTIDTGRLRVQGGAVVSASTFGSGKGGRLLIRATDSVELSGATANTSGGLFTVSNGSGNAGDVLQIDTGRLRVQDGAVISSRSIGSGKAGNIDITVRETLDANNGTIQTNTSRSAGGAITIEANAIRLLNNSDIISNVASGESGGGNIALKAGSILAFDDSDILAFSQDGRGGNITLDTRAFFGQNYRPAPRGTDASTLNGNTRVDVNATGTIASGTIVLPDTSFIQNSLTELPENQIDTNTLLANSCIVRRNQPTQGSFTITGAGGLPQRPGDTQMSNFPIVSVETPPDTEPTSNRVWQKGDAIVEPQGVYRLPNGKLVLSRNCF